ncbi:hypothetical protein D9758_003477 [Tetrapyrgos nigripes]|uniref:Uncharacterized protein n=1 Tax=Tetrapyrgos nigripes TaxID=182062 RepID=A0A8H5LW77_9AGAR|nr:hypothetical protein D9758_003477 [Tetrapyrgos nigripes]
MSRVSWIQGVINRLDDSFTSDLGDSRETASLAEVSQLSKRSSLHRNSNPVYGQPYEAREEIDGFAFRGLPTKVAPFSLLEAQAQIVVTVFANAGSDNPAVWDYEREWNK